MRLLNLSEFFKIIRKKAKYIVLFALCFSLLVFVLLKFVKKESYNFETKLLIADKNDAVNYNDVMLSEKIINTYNEIINSQSVVDEVIKDLGLKEDNKGELQIISSLKVEMIAPAGVMTLSYKDSDFERGKAILESITDKFIKKAKKLTNVDNISYIDPVRLKVKADKSKRIALFSFIVGLLSASLFFAVKILVSSVIYDKSHLDDYEVNILGIIPNKFTKEDDNLRKISQKIRISKQKKVAFIPLGENNNVESLNFTQAIRDILKEDLDVRLITGDEISKIDKNSGKLKENEVYSENEITIYSLKDINHPEFLTFTALYDAVVLIIKEGRSKKDDLDVAFSDIKSSGKNLLGVIYHK